MGKVEKKIQELHNKLKTLEIRRKSWKEYLVTYEESFNNISCKGYFLLHPVAFDYLKDKEEDGIITLQKEDLGFFDDLRTLDFIYPL